MVSRSEGQVAERVEERVELCRHHWVIDVAGGPTSRGVCRLCGAERQFKNFLDGTDWDDGIALPERVRGLPTSLGSSEELNEGE